MSEYFDFNGRDLVEPPCFLSDKRGEDLGLLKEGLLRWAWHTLFGLRRLRGRHGDTSGKRIDISSAPSRVTRYMAPPKVKAAASMKR